KEGQAHELYQRILKNLPDDATVLAIDFRGFGRSSSESISASDKLFDRSIDIDAAVAYLMQNHGAQRHQVILIGHSLGALQVLKAAHDQDYNAAIALGPGNFDLFLEENALSNYLHKFHKN